MQSSSLITKRDIEEIVGRVVGETVGDAIQLIAKIFNSVEGRLEDMEGQISLSQASAIKVQTAMHAADSRQHMIERKLDITILIVDGHSVQLKSLAA